MRDRYEWMARSRNPGPPPMRVSGLIIRLYLIAGSIILWAILVTLALLMITGTAAG